MMATVRELHEKAMALAMDATIARHEARHEDYKRLCAEAYRYERQAADMLPCDPLKEPSRGILYRSAAWLAHNAGMYQEAFDTAQEGARNKVPAWLMAELAEVINSARDTMQKAPSGEGLGGQQAEEEGDGG